MLLSFEDARHLVEEHAAKLSPCGTEEVCLLSAFGRVLAETIHADRDFPPFPRAARDGYAVRSADLARLPALLEVIGEIKAGAEPGELPKMVNPGQAASIMTGAPCPAGADAVVMVEYSKPRGNMVEITQGIQAGENIVAAGSEARHSDPLAQPGTPLNEATIAAAAAVGKSRVQVYIKPSVAVLATGDEIVDIDSRPGPHQVRNSNSYSLAAQIQQAGAHPVLLPIAPDEVGRLRELIESGLRSDLLLLAGGVSMGKYDLVEKVLSDCGAELFFTGAQIQPGRPVVFGRVREKYFVGLPGNPVSTMVTFDLFARPVIEALLGARPQKLVFLHARLRTEVKTKTGLKRFLPAVVSGEFEDAKVELVGWHGSGDIASSARANCYLVIPPDRDRIPAGEWMPVLLRAAR